MVSLLSHKAIDVNITRQTDGASALLALLLIDVSSVDAARFRFWLFLTFPLLLLFFFPKDMAENLFQAVLVLLTSSSINLNATLNNGITALHLACSRRRVCQKWWWWWWGKKEKNGRSSFLPGLVRYFIVRCLDFPRAAATHTHAR